MTKKYFSIITGFCIIFFAFFLFTFGSFAEENSLSVFINGESIEFDDDFGRPYIDSNGRTMVPLRIVTEKCGCDVNWDGDYRIAVVSKGDTVVSVPVGKSEITVNGTVKKTDTMAVINDSRIYLPIRCVLEAFGYSLGYDGSSKTVKILSFDESTGSVPLTVHFIDVEQGDCEFIDFGEFEVLIDGGQSDYSDRVISYVTPLIDGNLDVYIATHPDYDHIGAAGAIIRTFKIDTIIQSGYSKDTQAGKSYSEAIAETDSRIIDDYDFTIDMGGGAELQIIETGDDYEAVNNNSVVALLKYGNTKVLFTGDMQTDAENASLERFEPVNVLKVGHHGSNTSSGEAFLAKISPQYAVISCAKINGAYHPHKRTLNRLINAGSTVLATFKSGNLIMTANSKDFYWNKIEPLTLNDAGIYHIPLPEQNSDAQ